MAAAGQDLKSKSVHVKKKHVPVLSAEAVKMTHAGAGTIETKSLEMAQSAANHVTAESAKIKQSAILLIQANDVALQQAGVFALKAEKVQSPDIKTVFFNANSVSGSVQTLFTKESSLALGVGLGIVLLIYRAIRRLVK